MLLNILVDKANTIYNPYENTINRLKAISTEGSSALDDSAEIDSQPWPGFAVIDGGGGKEPDKKPDKDPKKTGAKVVASALTAAQLANMLNVSQKQDNTDQVIAPFDPSHITRVTDTGTGQVVIEYKDGTRRIFDKKDVPNHTLASTPIGAEGTNTEGTGKAKIIVTNERLEHSVLGEFNQNNRLINGGHGQENIDYLDANKIPYNIEKEFSNGVRVGNIPSHKNKFKRTGTGQAWFPENWTKEDIANAGEYIANLPENVGKGDGEWMFGEYNGVRVGVIKNEGEIGTIIPDNSRQP